MSDSKRKITVVVSDELLCRAQQASGRGISETVRLGLQLLAQSDAYDRLRRMRGTVRMTTPLRALKADR